MSEIGREYDAPGIGRFRVVGVNPDGSERAEYVGPPSCSKFKKGWTPPAPKAPPRSASRKRSKARTYQRRSYARYTAPVKPKPTKKEEAGGWAMAIGILLAICLMGSCIDRSNNRFPTPSSHGHR
jgi:hypothetical protein